MQKKIRIGNREINYQLKKNRRSRNMRITVRCDGSCLVSAPRWLSNSIIEKFIFEKASWIMRKIETFRESGDLRNGLLSRGSRKEYLENKNKAMELIKRRLNFFNNYYHFSFRKISIRNQRNRWGSCSMNKNLNFNYKLIFLPDKLADYIIVHELCHLQEFNHSRNFWNLVAKIIPDYQEMVKKLRKF